MTNGICSSRIRYFYRVVQFFFFPAKQFVFIQITDNQRTPFPSSSRHVCSIREIVQAMYVFSFIFFSVYFNIQNEVLSKFEPDEPTVAKLFTGDESACKQPTKLSGFQQEARITFSSQKVRRNETGFTSFNELVLNFKHHFRCLVLYVKDELESLHGISYSYILRPSCTQRYGEYHFTERPCLGGGTYC